ncbi:MAG TPA: glycosyltransferase [Ornithinibacter sp.]|nr:glycosyltransferase [Ornithinibacter sp.]
MAEIVVVTWDGGGNVPPALALADELSARGHGIRVLGHRGQRAAIEGAGHSVVEPHRAREFAAGDPHSTRELLATFGDRGMGADLLTELERRPADLVLVDALMLGALDAAHRSGVRYAVLEHCYDSYYRGALRGPLGLLLRATGLRPGRALRDAAVRVVTSLPELDPVAPDPNVRQVGPVVSWRPRAAGEPTVLVSLSTFAYAGMQDTLQTVLDACTGLAARVIVTTGPHIDPASLRAPAGVELHRFVPHAELMPRSTLLVGHGGHGTTMSALAHDLPVLVVPLDGKADHRTVGRSLERAGAGLVVPRTASSERIAAAVRKLLAEGPHRAAAARLGELVRTSPGARGGADALEEVVTTAITGTGR